MKRVYLMSILLVVLIAFTAIVLAQKPQKTDMETRWKKVEDFANRDLPESALKEVESILEQAKKENNSPEIIKAMMHKMRFITEKNPDETEQLMREFEDFVDNSKNPAEKAILHSMTAELHQKYYENNQYNINRRTELSGFVPEDIKEWSRNNFIDKVVEHADKSLVDIATLQNTATATYAAILTKGKDDTLLQPTLFDFLSYRKIELLKFVKNYGSETKQESAKTDIPELYNRLVEFSQKKNNKLAEVYAELQKLEFLHPDEFDEERMKSLEKLEKRFEGNEVVVEVLAEKAKTLYQSVDHLDKNDSSIRKALELIDYGIKKYPNYKRIAILKNQKEIILQKRLQVEALSLAKPNTNLKLKVTAENVKTVQLTIFRVNATALEYQEFQINNNSKKGLYPKRTQVETRKIELKTNPNYFSETTEIEIKTGDYGIYEYVIEESKSSEIDEKVIGNFVVTDLAFIQRKSGREYADIYVLDREEGNRIQGVGVKYYNQKWNGRKYALSQKGQYVTDNEGFAKIQFGEDFQDVLLFFEKGNDRYFTSESRNYGRYKNFTNDNLKDKTTTALFSDRSLYRPGQVLYFKGILYKSFTQEVLANETAKVELFNVRHEKIAEKTLKTNEFGSFAGEFVLPESGLNGAYSLRSGTSNITIYVEEYKRPSFEVTINKPKEEARFDEKVSVSGEVKAYAGYAIGDAQVKYRVVRRPHRFWWWSIQPEKIVASGTCKSDSEGKFSISFVPQKSTEQIGRYPFPREQFYTYYIYAEVTDPSGETQKGEQNLSVGDKSLFILADLPTKIDKAENFALAVDVQTLNGETVYSKLNYSLIELQASDDYIENRKDTAKYAELRTVEKGSFESKENLKLDLSKLNSGMYKLVLTTLDNRGKEVKLEKEFVLYGINDKKPAIKAYKWLLAPKTEAEYGENVQILFGTSCRNADVLYEIMDGVNVLERRWIKFSDEIKTFNIPFKETYGNGITVMFTFVKDGRIFNEQVSIKKKKTIKKLTPTLGVFRDKLQPGEKATWTFHIPQSQDEKKQAELLVGMYDASLDAIRSHAWSFDPTYYEASKYTPNWNFSGASVANLYAWFEVNTTVVPTYELSEINWFNLALTGGYWHGAVVFRSSRQAAAGAKMNMTVPVVVADMAVAEENAMVLNEKADLDEVVVTGFGAVKTVQQRSTTAEKPVTVRSNFNETAFFYPQLHTDKDGNVTVSFTAPESLTRWNVKMLAHTKDLYFGQNEFQVVTQKELMVQMNLPRFVRKSDKLTLTAKVVNLTAQAQDVNVALKLINPETNEVIQSFPFENAVALEANGSETLEWQLNEMKDFDLVIAKVIAKNENFSDGEQKYLPILPDKVLVTEAQTMTVRANETRTFDFDNFIQNLEKVDTRNFAVEFASNPAWYAVQALPLISTPQNENVVDYLSAYYANSLAGYIANANPNLKTVFEQWKKSEGSRDALLSNLNKNQELKNMLLDETPWLTDAKNESEQKQRLALLFDINTNTQKANEYLDKLLEMQLASGGFTWYKGMRESRYLTQEVLLNLARLNKMTKAKSSSKETEVVRKALNYLDLEIAKDFKELKKWNKNYYKTNVINNLQLFYLHMRSEYKDIPIADAAKDAVEFYTAQSEKYWTEWTLFGKAMMAVVAHRNGKSIVAENILKSLKEHALQSDEMGMYWAKNRAGWWWHKRPIATQTAIIEAVSEITNNQKDVDEMKIWLLKQKQTQIWDTPISTVDAVYALLNYGADWLSTSGNAVIKLGGVELKPQSKEAGTGYFKESIPTTNLKSEMGNITVQTQNSGSIGWGAAYWQYYQDLDKITSQGKEMQVSKKLFVEQTVNNEKSMLPIEQTTLKKGDKVITRLVLTTDRDMEFVALKDLRAACFEPTVQTSGYQWREGVGYYYTIKDASTQYFFDFLPKGTYVFEYEAWVNNTGYFTSGITSVQCLYAPEFVTHSKGEKVVVK